MAQPELDLVGRVAEVKGRVGTLNVPVGSFSCILAMTDKRPLVVGRAQPLPACHTTTNIVGNQYAPIKQETITKNKWHKCVYLDMHPTNVRDKDHRV